MKNVFTYRNGIPDGNVFLVWAPDSGFRAKLKTSNEDKERCEWRAYVLCTWIFEILFLLFLSGMILFCSGLSLLIEKKSSVLIAVFMSIGSVLTLVALSVAFIILLKDQKANDAYSKLKVENKKLKGELFQQIGFPSESFQIDVFGSRVFTKNGKEKRKPHCKKCCYAYDMTVWREGEFFCLFDGMAIFKFPFENLTSIKKIDRSIYVCNKNEKRWYNSAKYRPYIVWKYVLTGRYKVIYYYCMCFLNNGEEYELVFPAYEGKTLERLLDIALI